MLKVEPGFKFYVRTGFGRGIAMDETARTVPKPKTPRTARGRKTQRALLDAAEAEFGEKGFHESSIVSITKRAGVALGSFYTYFDSKDALFRALVRDMSGRVKQAVAPAITDVAEPVAREGAALEAFLDFARDHKEIYRIIDEAEFVAPDTWREHYERTASRIFERLQAAEAEGKLAGPIDEVHAWAMMGMNVFLGLKYGVMDETRSVADVARIANSLIARGLSR